VRSTGEKKPCLHFALPDFLSRPVALRIFMRLSLPGAAQVVVASSVK
jgi:hypothetical protein